MAASKKVQDTNALVKAIQDDKKLSSLDKQEFISLANVYSMNLSENLKKSSVELSDDTGVDVDTWRSFLTYPPIKRIIDSYVSEQIKKKADVALIGGTGTRDAINVRKAMLEETSGEDNTRYIILRLPDKVDDINER